ncbi:hypothetical protein GCM10010411_89220 [Actinomadura fulvescens]|uniref:Tetratricopeptide repeat protein n=2 Tax=Actinomadura fulvescens TaxID=46160 RepID=A0ABN3QW08_9ACTN
MRAQDAALAVYPARNWQARTQVELHRAGVLIRSGDVDEGARHLVRVLGAVPGELRHDGLLHHSAVMSLKMAPPAQAARASIAEARELLAAKGDA